MLPDELILFKLTPYLTLYDVVIFISTSKQTNKIADKLLKQVTSVHAPNANKQFMRHLTVKCPNVTKLSMRCKKFLSRSVILEINKLKLTSFECIGYTFEDEGDMNYLSKFDEYDDSDGSELFDLPNLTYLYMTFMPNLQSRP
jgi:D-alanyl-lipoteichoic acid acyltransferase DltB (MBOAT superfamily)